MSRTVLVILGVLLAIWLVTSLIGLVVSAVKFLFFIGLVALVITAVVGFFLKAGRD